jgi:hypothetical protein
MLARNAIILIRSDTSRFDDAISCNKADHYSVAACSGVRHI